jgi:hypothetical protein
MRHDATLLRSLRDGLRQAAHYLQALKLVEPDSDAEVQLMEELRSFVPAGDSEEKISR